LLEGFLLKFFTADLEDKRTFSRGKHEILCVIISILDNLILGDIRSKTFPYSAVRERHRENHISPVGVRHITFGTQPEKA
jgi:hypothetical protein